MTPATQQWIALGLVASALAYLASHAWRAWRAAVARRTPGCGPGCGCG